MLRILRGKTRPNCQGMSRRTALQVGGCGVLGLTLADRIRAANQGNSAKREKSVILLWLDGGPSQLETYDPKPLAPPEFRGPWGAIATSTPGIHISEMFPLQAKLAHKAAFVRSLHHDNGDHFAAAHWMLTGRFGSTSVNQESMFPSIGSYVSRLRGPMTAGLPTYVGLPSAQSVYLFPGYQGAAYLGQAYNPFDVNSSQRYLSARHTSAIQPPAFLAQIEDDAAGRTGQRLDLLGRLDAAQRAIDGSGVMESLDEFQQQAADFVLSGKAKQAFDIEQEDPAARDRYGRNAWGHYTLLARRLVEAGVGFVTVDMPHWDDHSQIEMSHGYKLPVVDQAVAALIGDLDERGLLDDVVVLVMGEFGRTPRLNQGQPGIPIPGRDHWGNAISALIAGGGIQGGQVIGATNDKAEHPIERPLKPADLLATVYRLLGIDKGLKFDNFAGRPVSIMDEGEAIEELIG